MFLLDVHDVFLSKLFSSRQKDLDDLRILIPQLGKEVIVHKLTHHCQAFLANDELRQIAQDNWQILYGEALPS